MRFVSLFLIVASSLPAQPPARTGLAKDLAGVRFREIGPFRGGRAIAVAGSAAQPSTYYFGSTGGGVFKTTDGGANWRPVSDGQFATGSVGAIAVAESDPNVVYVGMGEACIRGNASHGDGVYKSTDGGRTWKNMGLADTHHIGAIRVHPKNPDVVYVAALGHQFGPNEQRGVFRSTDGGKTWKQVLTRGPKAGAVDLSMDPTNPNVLYAGFWEVYRTPYSLESGGPGSGIWKSTDGGDNWTDLSKNPGLPKTVLGRIGVTVSPANSDRVWAIVEAEEGGVFRSDNGGRNWTRVNSDRNLRQRAWYYTHILADPKNADTVYVLNTGFYKSQDGGRTYTSFATPHGDNHGIWIAPDNPERMINSNDGGANVSTNGGRTWTLQNQQPTAQFYRVITDSEFPYGIYGAQQDNSTVTIKSRSDDGQIGERDWHDVGGGESGWIAPDPRDTNIVYAGSYGGLLTRYDHRTQSLRNVSPWPDNPMGYPASDIKYRFQWNYPLLFSVHDPKVLYAAAQVLFRSTNEGMSWEVISGDLTRNEKSRQGSSGGPITKDNTSIEYYSTIFTVAESPLTKGVIWTGSDDGLVQVTRDNGKTWSNVTPRDIPEWAQINSIDASPHEAGTAYVAATRYKSDDFRPLLYKTTDYGKTWTLIVNGIPSNAFTRVIREDPNKKGLLVAGTETGLYVSFDDGANWQSFQLNLPITPITDLTFQKRENELVVATQGRAFWIFDEMKLLQQMTAATKSAAMHLYEPKQTYRFASGGFGGERAPVAAGQNPASGVIVYYSFAEKPKGDVVIEFLDNAGKLIRKFSTADRPEQGGPAGEEGEGGGGRRGGGPAARVPAEAGLNRFVWNMRYPDASRFPGMILWTGQTQGPVVAPGTYTVRLTANGQALTQKAVIVKDPRLTSKQEDFEKQVQLALQLRDKVSQTNDAVTRIRDTKRQLNGWIERLKDDPAQKKVVDAAQDLNKKLTAVEEELYQTKNQSSQDPLNYPIKLNNKLAALAGVVQQSDTAPTAQSQRVYEELATAVNAQIRTLDKLMADDLAAFNKLVRDQNVPAITVKPAAAR
jgi:photosystem II stability/assembly factor-like uncharacterized protein